jgi:hypothetical protein
MSVAGRRAMHAPIIGNEINIAFEGPKRSPFVRSGIANG